MDRASLINRDCFFNAFGFITTTVKLNANVTTTTCIKNNFHRLGIVSFCFITNPTVPFKESLAS